MYAALFGNFLCFSHTCLISSSYQVSSSLGFSERGTSSHFLPCNRVSLTRRGGRGGHWAWKDSSWIIWIDNAGAINDISYNEKPETAWWLRMWEGSGIPFCHGCYSSEDDCDLGNQILAMFERGTVLKGKFLSWRE